LDKKAQGLSLNVIIIAVLALLVLIVLAVLLINYINGTNEGLKDCQFKGGKCVEYMDHDSCPSQQTIPGTTCPDDGFCCKHGFIDN